MENSSEIKIKLPVKIKYEALQQIIDKKLVGEFIEKENEGKEPTKFARIVDAKITQGTITDFNLDLYVGLKMLTSIFKNKIISLVVHLSTNFKPEEQKIEVADFKIKTKTHSWLGDKFLEVTFNSLLHNFIKQKMNLDLHSLINKRIEDINEKLHNTLEPKKGLILKGKINDLEILEIQYQEEYLVVFLKTRAQGEILLEEFSLE